MKEIYQQTVEEVLERVNGKKSGLTSEQVKRSREKCGWNELTEGKKKGILQILFLFFKSAIYQNIDVIQNRVCHIRDITAAARHQILMIGISGVHPDIFFWKFFLDPEN